MHGIFTYNFMGNFATQNVIFPSVMHHQLAPKLVAHISMLRILEEFARAPAPPVAAAAEHVSWIVKNGRRPNASREKDGRT